VQSTVPFAYFALVLLTVLNMLNYMDRFVVSAIVEPMSKELHFTDVHIGWLGSAFLLVYIIVAPIFGRLGDRVSRPWPIALAVTLWSVATVLSGLARNFPQMLAGRAAVGVGEGGYVSIAPALLSDCFPAARRGRVISILNMAIPVGSALGIVVGGAVSQAYGWRSVFFVAGIPGLLVALLALFLPDPPRGTQEGFAADRPATAVSPGAAGSLQETFRLYASLLQRAPFMYIVLGYAAYTFALGGLAFWTPTFLMRARHMTQTEATTLFGGIAVVGGFVGTFLGGWLGDLGLRRSPQAYLWVSAWSTLAAVPFVILALTPTPTAVFYPAMIVAMLLLFMSTGPINTALVNCVSPLERASAVGFGTFLMHLFGDVPSPTLIGWLSKLSSLGQAMLIVPVAVALGGVLWLVAVKAHARAPQSSLGVAQPGAAT